MSQEPGTLPLGLEFDSKTYWCRPGEMQMVQPTPRLVISRIGFRLLSSTWYGRLDGKVNVLVAYRRSFCYQVLDAKIGDFTDRFQIVVEHLVAEVRAVGDPDIALAVDLHAVRQVELAKALAGLFAAGLRQETPLRVIFPDAVVAVAVGDEDVALRVATHIGRTAEDEFLRR